MEDTNLNTGKYHTAHILYTVDSISHITAKTSKVSNEYIADTFSIGFYPIHHLFVFVAVCNILS